MVFKSADKKQVIVTAASREMAISEITTHINYKGQFMLYPVQGLQFYVLPTNLFLQFSQPRSNYESLRYRFHYMNHI